MCVFLTNKVIVGSNILAGNSIFRKNVPMKNVKFLNVHLDILRFVDILGILETVNSENGAPLDMKSK